MKQVIATLVLFLQFLLVGGIAIAQKKVYTLPKRSAVVLREDLSLLQKILEANHPSLYWYTPKDSMDAYFASAINSITDSLNEVQFKNKVARVVSKIRCGHTSVRFSEPYLKNATRFRYPVFPLNLKAWGDSLVVLNSLRTRDSVFKRGTLITGINGRNNRQLLDTIFQYMSADGYGTNYKNQMVSSNFPGWYKTILGVDSSYRINYIDSTGKEALAVIKNFSPAVDPSKREKNNIGFSFPKPTHKQIREMNRLTKRSLVIDTALNTAFIRLSTFSGNGLGRFFRRSFKTIQEHDLKHLVIDLRENGGGKVTTSILLTQYLIDHPFKVGDSVVAISRQFKYGRYIKPAWPYWFAMNFGSQKMKDGLVHFRHYETKLFTPKKRFHFNGDVTLVQGGFSFSATTMFIANLKSQKNITLLGEETGGGYYGNSAMYLPSIVLPNSGLEVSLPMFRLVMDPARPKGRGIFPDIEVPPSSAAIKRGIDLKMQLIRERIRQKAVPPAL